MRSTIFQKPGVTDGAWKSHHGSMRIVDFSITKQLEDEYGGSLGCIVICTSNGKIGTITHLDTTDIDKVDDFIKTLDSELKNNKESTKVILSGGSALNESKELAKKIQQAMQTNGYKIIGSYLDQKTRNPRPKTAAIEKDKVLVKEFVNQNQDQITEISFSNGDKKTYSKEKELPDFVKNWGK